MKKIFSFLVFIIFTLMVNAQNNRLIINSDGTVAYSDSDPNLKIDSHPRTLDSNYICLINGWARIKKVEVKADIWSDFVFKSSFKLKTLKEVEDFIAKNQHLPDVPSEKEVFDKGIDLASMNAILLQKIEELTLYVIEQNKKIDALQARIK